MTDISNNIILINDNVEDYHIIIEACKENTYPISYNQTTDTYDSIFEKYQSLLNDTSNSIQSIDHVALVSHGKFGNTFTFLEKEENMLLSKYIHSVKEIENIHSPTHVSGGEFPEHVTEPEHLLNNLETWSSFKGFIQKFNIQKSLDFLGCALLQSSNWKYILSELETQQHLNLNIRASDDDTGNLKVGGDWILESDNVNIKELYFHSETIEKWEYLLQHINIEKNITEISAAQYEYYEIYEYSQTVGVQITSLTFDTDSSLQIIGFRAFAGHDISTLTIPKSVTTIGNSAFARGSVPGGGITTLTFANNSSLESIGSFAF